MVCTPVKIGATTAIVCVRRAPRRRCACGAWASLLCDHPKDWRQVRWSDPDPNCVTCRGNPYWGKTLSSWERCACVLARTPSRTCDRPMCRACATEIGPDRHLCPEHRQHARQGALAL